MKTKDKLTGDIPIPANRQGRGALQQNELLFRALFEFSPDATILIDPYDPASAWPIVDCNTAACRMNGYTRDELIGQPIDIVNAPTDTPLDRSDYLKQLHEAGTVEYEVLHRRKDGTLFPVEVSTTLIKFGEHELLLGIDRDITERKRLEGITRDNEEKLRAIYEGTHDAVMLLNEKGFFDCNPQTLKMFGFKVKEEFTAVHPSDVSPAFQPDGRDSLSASQEHIQTAYQQGYDSFEWVHRRTNGEDFPAEVLLSAFDFGGQRVLQATVRDITERKRAEAERKDEQQRLRTILETIRVPTIISRLSDGIVIYANQAIAEVSHVNLDKLIGFKTGGFYADPDDQKTVLQALRQSGHINDFEVQFRRTDGSLYWALLSSRIMNYEGEACVLSSYMDITGRKQMEEALRESQRFLQTIMDNIPQSIFWKDSNLTYLGCNSAFAADAGIASPSNILGKNDWDMPWKEQAELYRADDSLVMKNGVPKLNYEEPQTTPDGSKIWLRTSKIPLYDSNGNVFAVLGMYEDITGHKQVEEALRESEDRFRHFTEATDEALIFHEQGRIVDVNPSALAMFGFAKEADVIGRSLLEFVVPEMHSLVLEKMQSETVPPYEVTCIRTDKSKFPVETLTRSYRIGDRTIRATSVRDISERKRAEEALRESEARYSALVTQAKDGIVIIQDNILQFVNDAMGDMLGYTAAEMTNTPIINYIAPESRELIVNRIKARLAGQEVPTLYEAKLQRKDGTLIDAELSAGAIEYRGRPADAGLIRDITERKQLEEDLLLRDRALASSVNGVVLASLDRKIIYANQAFCKMTGYTHEEAMQLDGAELTNSAQDVQMVREKIQKQGFYTGEGAFKRQDGTTISVDLSISPIVNAEGQVIATQAIFTDTTERKKLERQIQTAFERRGLQVQLSTRVSQSIAAASSLEELYERVVNQINEQFGYYHTQVLRCDPAGEAIVLVAGYGEVGEKMLAAGYRQPMGKGLMGTAAATGQTVLRPVLEIDSDWQPHSLLPGTKGEIAVPIKLGDTVLGVLDVQVNVPGSLGADDQLLLESLCGQIATAIESTRLRQEMAERLEEINRLYRAMSHEGWQDYRQTADVPSSFMYDQHGLRPAENATLAEELFAQIPLEVPGGEVIGTLSVAEDPQRPITPEDEAFLQQISEQVALALESARLFEQTQSALGEVRRRASELETVAEMSATTSAVLDPDKLLQTVVDLTKEKFGLYHAHIYVYEESWNTLLLAAGAGEVGRKLVAEEHAIPMSIEQSLVARAARERKAVIVNDVNSEPGFLPNPLLPETRAEMAVPMTAGDKLLGVFDVQSNNVVGFSEEDANIYVTLAAQVGVALQNARLYMEQAALVTQLRELDRLKSSFLANMSHELRTPLNSILGFADVIIEELDGPLTENMSNDLRLIQKNGQHLLHLINDVLDMAKIEAGRMNLNPENFKAFEVLEEVTSITSTLASEKNLALFIQEDSERNVQIYADRTRLRQVMINLVNNAIKFTENGSISLKLECLQGARILIAVKDTGIGIPPDKLEAIFQEFTQVDSSSTRKAGGTGLGLPISRKLVEMHGGRLWAESNGIPGEGSTFFVELPIEARLTETVEKQAK